MKKTLSILLACLTIVAATAGCSSGGVSQEEYDKVVAERDALKEQYGVTDSDTSAASASSDDTTVDTPNDKDFDAQAVLDKNTPINQVARLGYFLWLKTLRTIIWNSEHR